MTLPSRLSGWLAALAAALLCSSGAGAAAEKPSGPNDSVAVFPGTNSKEPISIDADELVYYDKEHKAVYSGNVVVIQGDTKMTCSAMTVFLDRAPTQGAPQPANGQSGPSATPASSTSTRRDLSPSSPRRKSPLAITAATTKPRTKCGSSAMSRSATARTSPRAIS